MPLTRANVTVASRIMLPVEALFFLLLGLNYAATDQTVLARTPALAYADAFLPLPVWGWVFLLVAGLITAALATRIRILCRYALLLGCLAMLVWAGVNVLAALRGEATPLGWVWPAFIVCACLASYRSLSRGER